MFRRLSFLAIFLVLTLHSIGQNEEDIIVREMAELWAEQNDSETIPDDIIEILHNYRENPININDTTSEALADLPFLSAFQRDAIYAYILQNGFLLSLSELNLISALDSLTVQRLQLFVTAAPPPAKEQKLKELIHSARHNLRTGFRTFYPLSRGYNESIYSGPPFRTWFRYNINCSDRITFQLAGENDAGEPYSFRSPQYGFDYYNYYLIFKDFGIVKRAIIGKYQLQFGQGATLWSGFASWNTDATSLWKYGQGIRQASAFSEYGYLRGVAAQLSLHKTLDLTIFYSNVDRDATASASDTTDNDEQFWQSFYQTGYHRTENELAKKGNINEQLFGAHLQYRRKRMALGITAHKTLLSDNIIPTSRVYNNLAFSGKEIFNGGIDATYRTGRLLLFGETSFSIDDSSKTLYRRTAWLPITAVTGMMMQFNSDNCLSVAWRYSSPTFHNLHFNLVGMGSTSANERDVIFSFMTRLPLYVYLRATANFFSYPWMRYRIYSPSSGVDYRLLLSRNIAPYTTLECQYRHKEALRNSDHQLYSVEQTRRDQIAFSLNYSPSKRWHMVSRLVYSWFNCDDHSPEKGFVLCQDISHNTNLNGHPFSVTARMAIFDISGYDARIFTYENDLMYESSIPSLYGNGMRCYLILRHTLSQQLSLAFKYAVSFYPGQETIGSGYDLIVTNSRHEIKAQLRWCL